MKMQQVRAIMKQKDIKASRMIEKTETAPSTYYRYMKFETTDRWPTEFSQKFFKELGIDINADDFPDTDDEIDEEDYYSYVAHLTELYDLEIRHKDDEISRLENDLRDLKGQLKDYRVRMDRKNKYITWLFISLALVLVLVIVLVVVLGVILL